MSTIAQIEKMIESVEKRSHGGVLNGKYCQIFAAMALSIISMQTKIQRLQERVERLEEKMGRMEDE